MGRRRIKSLWETESERMMSMMLSKNLLLRICNEYFVAAVDTGKYYCISQPVW